MNNSLLSVSTPKALTLHFITLFQNKRTVFLMTLCDRKNTLSNAYFGVLWSFLQPIVVIVVLWFVFCFGLKSSHRVAGTPFALWLTMGIIPWSFMTDGLTNGVEAVTSYDFLVKKVVFKVEILPAVKILSSLVVHIVFFTLLLALSYIYGALSFYAIQTVYYLICGLLLIYGIVLASSAANVFAKDISKIQNIFIYIGFWITPVFWNLSDIPLQYKWLLKLNPFFYIVNGYRDSLLYHIGFWQRPLWTIYFWFIVSLILLFGIAVFSKIRPYFADAI